MSHAANKHSLIKDRTVSFLNILDEFPEFTYIGDPILRQSTEPVNVDEGIKIGKELSDILLRYREIAQIGRGLSAPQIGKSKSVFVTYVHDNVQIFINPTIVEKSSETNFYKELCLSSGIVAADVERATRIVMKWTDEKGTQRKKSFDGFLARLYQHEEAHLRGIVNVDEATHHGLELTSFDPLNEKLRTTR